MAKHLFLQYQSLTPLQRLSGASLLVFANKTDVNGCMKETEIQEVSEACKEMQV